MAMGFERRVASVPIVFVGYGISAKDPAKKLDYDDYAGLNVDGKAVLILRREPQQDREDSPFDGKQTSDYATFAQALQRVRAWRGGRASGQ